MADLLPLILFAAWRWFSLRLWHPLRALCVVLLLLVPVEPQIRRFSRGLDLWVLVDQSASAAQVMASQLPEWQSLLEKSKSRDDRIFYLDYAEAQQVLMLNGLAQSRDVTHRWGCALVLTLFARHCSVRRIQLR